MGEYMHSTTDDENLGMGKGIGKEMEMEMVRLVQVLQIMSANEW